MLLQFAERFDVPVATTLSGKGVMPEGHPLALGVFGYGGSRWAIDAICSNDVEVLLVIGSDLSQRDTMQWDPKMLPSKALIQVDADPLLIGRTWSADVPIVADPASMLKALAELQDVSELEAGRASRFEFVRKIRGLGPRYYNSQDRESDAMPMHPARVVGELRSAFPDNGVLCVDSGAHRAWFAEYWETRHPGTHFSLTNLGPMGGAIPLGIGAKNGSARAPAHGRHGGRMYADAWHGAAHCSARKDSSHHRSHEQPSIRQYLFLAQRRWVPAQRRLTDIPDIDWVAFAKSMGGDGERVEHPEGIAEAVKRGISAPGPYLLDLRIDKTYPTPVSVWRERQQEWEDNE